MAWTPKNIAALKEASENITSRSVKEQKQERQKLVVGSKAGDDRRKEDRNKTSPMRAISPLWPKSQSVLEVAHSFCMQLVTVKSL